jgi:hypothetical protein
LSLRIHALPAWIEDERSLLAYLVCPHDGHCYPEDLIDAVALMAAWVMAGISFLLVLGVLAEGLAG